MVNAAILDSNRPAACAVQVASCVRWGSAVPGAIAWRTFRRRAHVTVWLLVSRRRRSSSRWNVVASGGFPPL